MLPQAMRFRAFSAVVALGVSLAGQGRAQATGSSPASDAVLVPRDATSEAQARDHYERALTEYRAGKYRSAVQQLELALAKDPAGKDLVFNLALVHEKLGELDRSIAYLERFLELEADPAERSRAEQAITRMRGARAEAMRVNEPAPAPTRVFQTPHEREPQKGRFDGWVGATAGVAAVAVVVGVVFGVRALEQQRAWRNEARKPGASLEDISERADEAQTSAFVANVAFSLGVVAAGGSAILYFARPAVPNSGPSSPLALGLYFSAEF